MKVTVKYVGNVCPWAVYVDDWPTGVYWTKWGATRAAKKFLRNALVAQQEIKL